MLGPDQLILEAATGARQLTPSELQQILEHVAQAGFDPAAQERVRGELAGLVWQGRVLKGSDRLPPAERHYIKHVFQRQEWPRGTTRTGYLNSLSEALLDPHSMVLISRYQNQWQLGVVGPSGQWRGPHGGRWMLVEYRVATGHWVTGYQLRRLRELKIADRTDITWLRGPR